MPTHRLKIYNLAYAYSLALMPEFFKSFYHSLICFCLVFVESAMGCPYLLLQMIILKGIRSTDLGSAVSIVTWWSFQNSDFESDASEKHGFYQVPIPMISLSPACSSSVTLTELRSQATSPSCNRLLYGLSSPVWAGLLVAMSCSRMRNGLDLP